MAVKVKGSLETIADGARKVSELVDEITAASSEQAQGIEQITKAISQMDQVTQSTASNAEESASASEELSAQAESDAYDLTDAVAGVTLGDLANRLAQVTRDGPIRAKADAGDLDLF